MNDLIYSLAADFSVEFGERFGKTTPADGYLDHLVKVLGETPSKVDVESVLKNKVPILCQELSNWMEAEIEEIVVSDVLEIGYVNYFGSEE